MGINPQGLLLESILDSNNLIKTILKRAPKLKLSNWYLGGGCIAQTVWNNLHNFTPTSNIKDYDLVYFDETDISWENENDKLVECREMFSDLDADIDLKNEARVHLWYKSRFGIGIAPYESVEDAIHSWPTTATSLGVRRDVTGNFITYAPFGLEDLFGLVVRPNKRQITRDVYIEKVDRWIKAWPRLRIIPWE